MPQKTGLGDAGQAAMVMLLSPLVVCIVGLLMHALSTNGKLQRIGEIMFFVGLFWLVGELGPALGLGTPAVRLH